MSGASRFVYYRVAEADLPACVAAVAALQTRWRAESPGLVTGLMRRPGLDPDGRVTLMETYAGIDEARLEALEEHASRLLVRWIVGDRHTETFVPCV
jgi:hypothetical protein